jgi:hypothetical protein
MVANINNYAFYGSNWGNPDSSILSVTSGGGYPGATWVSLYWGEPVGGLVANNYAGYVICRSSANAEAPPQTLSDPGTTIVYVGINNFIGDPPLSKNTAGLLTADAGLLPSTTYWYSIFVVTPIPAQVNQTWPNYTPGKYSKPYSFSVTTNPLPNPIPNLFSNPTFLNATSAGISSWTIGSLSGNATQPTPGIPTGFRLANESYADPNDVINNGNLPFDKITDYLSITVGPSTCPGNCNGAGECVIPRQPLPTVTEKDCFDTNGDVIIGQACSCQSGKASVNMVLYQTITLPEFKPGTLYTFSIWYRTNNPISIASATNGNNQSYTPSITIFGNGNPYEPGNNQLGFTQLEQSLQNEGNVAVCLTTDSENCPRKPSYSGQGNNYDYSNLTSVWQKAGMTFIVGSSVQSPINSPYNYTATYPGDPIQSLYKDGTAATTPETIKAVTIVISIPSNQAGCQGGVIDLANATLVEGLIPYTDPFWNGKPGDNLIFNPNFWGVQTLTQGTSAPGWVVPSPAALLDSSQVCAPTCQGGCIICQGGATGETCANTCTGSCDAKGNCSTGIGSCTGNCSGSCQVDPTKTCTGGTGTCQSECGMTGSQCLDGSSASCGRGGCAADCMWAAGSCHLSGGNCYTNSDCTESGDYCNSKGPQCTNDPSDATLCAGSECKGTCHPVCQGDSSQTCSDPNGSCTGTCASAGGICSGGVGTCSGSSVCFDTSVAPYTNITNNKQLCTAPFESGYPTYLTLQGCSCQIINLQQGNILGISGFFMGASILLPGVEYTLSFDYYVIANDSAQNSLDLYMYDMTKSNEITDAVSFLFPIGASSAWANSSNLGYYDISLKTQNTGIYTFTLKARANPNLQFQIYQKNLSVAITNVTLKQKTPTVMEGYGMQNPIPAITSVSATTQSTLSEQAVLWRAPQTASTNGSVGATLFNETAQTLGGTELGWPHGLTILGGFHTAGSLDNVTINADSDGNTQLQTLFGNSSSDNYVMALTVNNSSHAKNPNQSAYLMSNAYYGAGQWDIWLRLEGVYDAENNKIMNGSEPANPTGCSFAFWIYHAIDYSVSGGPKLLYEANPLRNTEIDIEMNGACPDATDAYANNVGRLNGWGGQWGGAGNNFTMHTQMPNNITLNDGEYHKLSILFHSGVDVNPLSSDPNGVYPTSRQPGFIKWFVDDVEWGCGWTGNQYGLDNIPITATRIVAGPWNPDWAGCQVCCAFNQGKFTEGCCPHTIIDSPTPATCTTSGEAPNQVVWDHAVFNVAQMQFTPICTDCTLDCTKSLNACTTPPVYANPYLPAVTLPNRPDASKGQKIGPPNRTPWLPETKPFLTCSTD